jgi:hypothetical protein
MSRRFERDGVTVPASGFAGRYLLHRPALIHPLPKNGFESKQVVDF